MKVEGQHVERQRHENRGAVGADGVGLGRGISYLGRGLCRLPRNFFNFLTRYVAFWVQYDAFSDITRPVPNSLHSQPAENSDIINPKPISATLGKGCRAFYRIFHWWGNRLKGQDVRATGGIAFGRDSDQS